MKKPIIISGPCSAESREQLLSTVKQIIKYSKVDIIRAGIWKPRTHPGSFEGIGEKGLKWLEEIKSVYNIPVSTEVASSTHVRLAKKYGVDILWIGARTTVSPFAVQEIADTLKEYPGTKIMIKNPVNPDIELWIGAIQRLLDAGVKEENITLIHRGFSLYGTHKYRNQPVWSIPIEMRRRFPNITMICDPSHIAGDTKYVKEISQIAANLHYDGLMIESHICPAKALSDSKQQLTPLNLAEMLNSIIWREESCNNEEYEKMIKIYRSEIDEIDISILDYLAKRMQISDKIGELKRKNNVTIIQKKRWSDIVNSAIERALSLGLSETFISKILEAIHLESIRHQNTIIEE